MESLEVHTANNKRLIDVILLKIRSLLHFRTGVKALYCILSCSHRETSEVGVIDIMGGNRSADRSHTFQGRLQGTMFNSFSLCCT